MKKLNFYAPINKLSYGYSSFNILKELVNLQVEIAYFPISNQIEVDNQQDLQWIQECYQKGIIKGGYKDVPCIKLWHQHSLSMFPFCSKQIGFPIFELDNFTEQEKNHLNNCDELMVCSQWAKEIVINTTNKKDNEIFVIPLGIDLNIFKHNPIKLYDDKCIFLIVGKREIRKLADLIPEIWGKAFEEIDNVELWIAWTNMFETNEDEIKWQNFYKTSKLGNKIRFLPRYNTQQELAQIYNQVDCLWSCSRAEGFMLPAIEAMACGLDIISCNYSGVTEFLNNNNAYLIDIENKEIAFDGKFFTNNIGQWAKFENKQIEQCIEYLRKIYKNKQEQGNLLNKQGLQDSQNFTWSNSVKKILEIMK